jgi:D-tyrosyl-tRNA(Tyr) deacylase
LRAVVQRVASAAVTVDGSAAGRIDRGLLVLLGVHESDDEAAADRMADKLAALRIFEDDDGRMNLSARSCASRTSRCTATPAAGTARASSPQRALNARKSSTSGSASGLARRAGCSARTCTSSS